MKKSDIDQMIKEAVKEVSDKTYISATQKAVDQGRTLQSKAFATKLFDKYFKGKAFVVQPTERYGDFTALEIIPMIDRFRITSDFIDIAFSTTELDGNGKPGDSNTIFSLIYNITRDIYIAAYDKKSNAEFIKDFMVSRKAAMFFASLAKAFNPETKITINSFRLLERFGNKEIIDAAHATETPSTSAHFQPLQEEFDNWVCMECHAQFGNKRVRKCPKCGSGEIENIG